MAALLSGGSGSFDLVVLDEDLGDGLKGTHIARALRDAGSQAIIVGASGDAMADAHFAAGCDLSWGKPLPRRTMGVDLRRAWAARRRAAAAE